jgi:NAD(P)-dependent dehydrogenase (short-subunit alcohol dehydrogenase family)
MNPSGQVAIVTGGGSGLGEATARALAAKGAKLALLDVAVERAQKVAAELGGIAVKCDVSSADGAEAAIAEAVDKLGGPRILINCAGIGLALRTTSKDGAHPLDLYRKIIEVNLIGTFNMIRLFAVRCEKLEPLEGGERGVIVNTASVAAYDGQIGQAAYSASKGGVVGMTLPVARDLSAAGIRLNTVAPGLIDTPIYDAFPDPDEFKANLGQNVLFPKRLGRADELASMVVECLTNSYMNGETIRVDGGIRMPPK